MVWSWESVWGDIVKPIGKIFSTPNYLLAHVIHI